MRLFAGGEGNPADLAEPLHQVGDILAEILLQNLPSGESVLDDVVEQSRDDTREVQPKFGEDVSDFQRMG